MRRRCTHTVTAPVGAELVLRPEVIPGSLVAGPLDLPPLPEPGPHLLRVLEGAVVDFLAPVLSPDARCWVATCWPDATVPGGWARAAWWPPPYHGRGYVPVASAYADVVEFAADVPFRTGWWQRRTQWLPVRWYGVVLEDGPDAMLVYGPYPTPDAALAVTDQLRATFARHRTFPPSPY